MRAFRVQPSQEPCWSLPSTVQRQIAGLFIVEDTGAHELKGVPAPVTLYRILRVSGGRRRKGARLLTPFIGREEDIGVLARRWERARAGEGQFVLIVGEPGIGKSRLVEEFRAQLGEDATPSWIGVEFVAALAEYAVASCPGLGTGSVWRSRGCAGTAARRARIWSSNTSSLTPRSMLLAGRAARRHSDSTLNACQAFRLMSFTAGSWRGDGRLAIACARVQPLVLVFEDLQWFDPIFSSISCVRSAIAARIPLRILATARAEFGRPWILRPHHSLISLTPLDDAQVRRMVAELAHQPTLSSEVIKGVSERAGGVPLFVEGGDAPASRARRTRRPEGDPADFTAVARGARLDRLGSARGEVAQIGAGVGAGSLFLCGSP